jgi:hypothetical protein
VGRKEFWDLRFRSVYLLICRQMQGLSRSDEDILRMGAGHAITPITRAFTNAILSLSIGVFQSRILFAISQFSLICALYGSTSRATMARSEHWHSNLPQIVQSDFRSLSSVAILKTGAWMAYCTILLRLFESIGGDTSIPDPSFLAPLNASEGAEKCSRNRVRRTKS